MIKIISFDFEQIKYGQSYILYVLGDDGYIYKADIAPKKVKGWIWEKAKTL